MVVTFPQEKANEILRGSNGDCAIENFYIWLTKRVKRCSYEEVISIDPSKIFVGSSVREDLMNALRSETPNEYEARDLMSRFGPCHRIDLNYYEIRVEEDAIILKKAVEV